MTKVKVRKAQLRRIEKHIASAKPKDVRRFVEAAVAAHLARTLPRAKRAAKAKPSQGGMAGKKAVKRNGKQAARTGKKAFKSASPKIAPKAQPARPATPARTTPALPVTPATAPAS